MLQPSVFCHRCKIMFLLNRLFFGGSGVSSEPEKERVLFDCLNLSRMPFLPSLHTRLPRSFKIHYCKCSFYFSHGTCFDLSLLGCALNAGSGKGQTWFCL